MVRHAHIVLVGVMVEVAKGGPAARLAPSAVFAVGRKAPRLADKPKRRKRGQPLEPLRRVGSKVTLSLPRTHQHVAPLAAVFDQGRGPRAGALICRMQALS